MYSRVDGSLHLDFGDLYLDIDEATAKAAKNRPIKLIPTRLSPHSGTWFADWVYEEAADIAGPFQGTMRVRTTLIPSLQALAEDVVSSALKNEGETKGVTQAALVAMLPNGAVVAMVGGRNYQESEFNRAVQGMRQPGSAFKLFVYYAALRNGMSPRDRIEDAPLEIDGWSPENFERALALLITQRRSEDRTSPSASRGGSRGS